MSAYFDLDKLERLEREATPGPWHWKHNDIVQRDEAGKFVADVAGMYYDDDGYPNWGADNAANTELIIALRNAAPALIAELRTLRARVDELERDARLGAVVRAEVTNTNTYGYVPALDLAVRADGARARGDYAVGYLLRAIADALRAEEGGGGG